MSVTGLDKLEQKYVRTFPKRMRNAVMNAMGQATEKIVNDMRSRAPVYAPTGGRGDTRGDGTRVVPGALRASIGWKFGDAPRGAITLGSISEKSGEETIRVTIFAGGKGPGGDAFYARWVEHGTRKWAGKPFFYGTWRDWRRRWRSAVTRAIRKELAAIAGV